ncbi:MAG TPA: hypothetical protein VF590_15290, partial [Isosphaeraceae bacterium]
VRRPRGVERAYPNRLIVRLEYRAPVAEVRVGPSTFVLDGDAVILPADDLDRDAAGPLVPLHGLDPPADGRPGIQWGTEVDGLAPPDPRAAAAARLASFLKARLRPGSAAAAPFRRLAVTSCADDGSLWVRADGRYWIAWGDPPGAEGPGRPTAAEKWDQLRDWVRRGGGSARRADPDAHDYLDFTRAGVVVRRGKPRTP